jgi:hypothetical protein
MSINIKSISEKVFNILKGFGWVVESYGLDGNQVVDPVQATRFLVNKPNILVRVDPADQSISLKTSEDLRNEQIYKLHRMLKNLVKDYGIPLNYEVFNRTLKPKGESQDIARSADTDMTEVMEGFGPMVGSTRTSYQPLDNVKIVVKHRKPVNEEIRGSRSRNIQAVYVQSDAERYRMPVNNMAAARAMARHVQLGGSTQDQIAEHINNLATDYVKLSEFMRYVRNSKMINESNQEIVETAQQHLDYIRHTFKKLSGSTTYQQALEQLELDVDQSEIMEDSADLQDKFTEKHFDQRVSEVLPTLLTLNYKRKAFENHINNAIQTETFENLKNMLQENDIIEFSDPASKLSHQINQLGYAATDLKLSQYLQDVSKKVQGGQSLSQFEYGTVKSCLLAAASQQRVNNTSLDHRISESYARFLDQFDI